MSTCYIPVQLIYNFDTLVTGFLLGDGAGMGKGWTLAGFAVENIARGQKKHVWILVSSNLYEGEFVCY